MTKIAGTKKVVTHKPEWLVVSTASFPSTWRPGNQKKKEVKAGVWVVEGGGRVVVRGAESSIRMQPRTALAIDRQLLGACSKGWHGHWCLKIEACRRQIPSLFLARPVASGVQLASRLPQPCSCPRAQGDGLSLLPPHAVYDGEWELGPQGFTAWPHYHPTSGSGLATGRWGLVAFVTSFDISSSWSSCDFENCCQISYWCFFSGSWISLKSASPWLLAIACW